MATYYAVCDANGPVSVALDGDTEEQARASFAPLDGRAAIDRARTDLEDALGIDGAEMSSSDFADALREAGAKCVAALDVAHNAHAGTTAAIAGGWALWCTS